MTSNKLIDAQCRAAKSTDKAQKIFDGGGLFLWISPKGAKVWRLAYRLAGKPQTMSLGAYPSVSLASARAKRDELKAQMRDGADPMAPRKATRATAEPFKTACEAYWQGRKDVTEQYRDNALRGLELHLWPALGAKPIDSITRNDLLAELQRMDAAGLHVYVRKVRMWSSQVFDWAVELDKAKINPAALIRPERAFGKAPVENFAAVPLAGVPELMQRLALESELQSAIACRMLALTWVRTTELRQMEWSEIEGDLWRIPRARMKRGREHLVPLSTQAVAILKTMKARNRGGRYVFESDRRADRPMSENAILYLLHRIGYKGRMTGHGWRSVASTWANERGHNTDAIERQLAHVPDDDVRAAYNRAAYLPERRQMLQAWADWLDDVSRAG